MSTRGPWGHLSPRAEDEEIEAPDPEGRRLRTLAPYFRPYLWQTAVTIVLMLTVTAGSLAQPALAQYAIDHGIGDKDSSVLVWCVALFVGAGIVAAVAAGLQIYASTWLGQRVLFDLRNRLFRHIMDLELGYHEKVPTGRTVSRLTSDIEALNQLVTEGVTTLVLNGLTFLGVVVILFVYDAQLALMCFSVFPLLVIVTAWYRVGSSRAYRRTREKVAHVLAVLQETLSGMRVVQGFGRQDAARATFNEANVEYRQANMATIYLSSLYFPGIELLAAGGTLAVLWSGTNRVLDGDLTVGVMVAFIGYLSNFFDPIQQLSQLYSTVQSATAALEKINGVLKTGPRVADQPGAPPLPPVAGAIDLTGVTFEYVAGRPVIEGLSLHINAGETIALVGATGAGKSTLAKLIARFYDPQEGTVAIDGHDLRAVTVDSLRQQMAMVPQEGHLFAGTLADNLRFGRPDATDDQMLAALEAVDGGDLLAALPDGLASEVTERGSGLSAGQRQLVSFARALLADPRILILDEATSSVDVRTEQRIEQAMARLLAGRTSILIAHRLSTIRNADRIVVLDHGRIVEQGSHDQLIAAGGRYAALHGDWHSLVGEVDA